MKKNLTHSLVIAAVAAFAATGAIAGPVAVNQYDWVKFADGPGDSPGGAFYVTNKGPAGTSNLGTFETFCIEFNEYMNTTDLFKVKSITSAAINGGAGGSVGGSDPLDSRTAFLYTKYMEDQSAFSSVTGWTNNGSNSIAEGTAMQLAIWFLEQEISSTANSTYYNKYLSNATALALVGLANQAGWTNNGRVSVLNLVNASGGRAQDQLYLAPVPLPAAGWLMFSALGLGGLLTRRRASQAAAV